MNRLHQSHDRVEVSHDWFWHMASRRLGAHGGSVANDSRHHRRRCPMQTNVNDLFRPIAGPRMRLKPFNGTFADKTLVDRGGNHVIQLL